MNNFGFLRLFILIALIFQGMVACKEKKSTNKRTKVAGQQTSTDDATADTSTASDNDVWGTDTDDDSDTDEDSDSDEDEEESTTSSTGCFLDDHISKMEIYLNGATLTGLYDDSRKEPMQYTGVPEQLTFFFAPKDEGFAFTQTDAFEKLKKEKGKIATQALGSYKVSSLSHLSISLDGAKFRSELYYKRDFWKGQEERFRVTDLSRFQINSISIFVNGTEIYRKGGMQRLLKWGANVWKDPQAFRDNSVMKGLLANNEACDQFIKDNEPAAENTQSDGEEATD